MKHCTNCNSEMDSNATICTTCGVPVGKVFNFCETCGNKISNNADICTSCGKIFREVSVQQQKSASKSKVCAGILAIIFGAFGAHNFYLGFTSKAIIQLCLTIISCGLLSFIPAVWGLIEGIIILTDSNTVDAYGKYLD